MTDKPVLAVVRGETDDKDRATRTHSSARGHVSTASFSLVAQALQSAQTLGLSLMMARATSASEFGQFALLFAYIGAVVLLSRSLGGDILALTADRARADRYQIYSRQSLGFSLAMSAGAGALGLAVSIIVGHGINAWLATGIASIPIVVLADAYARVLWAMPRGGAALAVETTSVLSQVALWAVLLLLGRSEPFLLMGAWLIGCTAAVGIGVLLTRARPALSSAFVWIRSGGRLGRSLLGEFVLTQGTQVLLLIGASIVVGSKAAGAIRGAWVLTGPTTTLVTAGSAVALPWLASAHHRGSRLIKPAAFGAAGLSALAALWCGLILVLPASLGSTLLGDSWSGARAAFPGVAVTAVSGCIALGGSLLLRVLRDGRSIVRYRAAQSVGALVLGLGCGARWGAAALTAGVGAATLLVVPLWWLRAIWLVGGAGAPSGSTETEQH